MLKCEHEISILLLSVPYLKIFRFKYQIADNFIFKDKPENYVENILEGQPYIKIVHIKLLAFLVRTNAPSPIR